MPAPIRYDAGSRLAMDCCALQARDHTNVAVVDYQLDRVSRPAAPRTTACDKALGVCGEACVAPRRGSPHPLLAALDHGNLRPWDGYGVNTNAVDRDTQLRFSTLTHDRSRIQLAKRVFEAGPDLGRGAVEIDDESVILAGQTVAGAREARLAERTLYRPDPTLAAAPARPIEQPWTRGGDMSRNVARSDSFLRSLGYEWDGKVWRRAATRPSTPEAEAAAAGGGGL